MEKRPLIPDVPGFRDLTTRAERIALLIYLPIHVVALPRLLPYLAAFVPGMSSAQLNVLYYVVGLAFMLIFCRGLLRAGFDAALDRLGLFVISVATAWLLELALNMIISSLAVMAGMELGSSPNNDAIEATLPGSGNLIFAIAVFMAPLVEEPIFRGLAFGALHRRSRAAAWIVSTLLFSLYHVWNYALSDPRLLLYAILYIPGALALNWSYERTSSIWAPIAYHMLTNAIALSQL